MLAQSTLYQHSLIQQNAPALMHPVTKSTTTPRLYVAVHVPHGQGKFDSTQSAHDMRGNSTATQHKSNQPAKPHQQNHSSQQHQQPQHLQLPTTATTAPTTTLTILHTFRPLALPHTLALNQQDTKHAVQVPCMIQLMPALGDCITLPIVSTMTAT
jgi:hypothetical protein